VHALLEQHGIKPRKSLGQHFLADPNTAQRIAARAEVGPGERVLEIGPGLGSLSVELIAAGADLVAVERDARLASVLGEVLAGSGLHADVIVADALAVEPGRLAGGGRAPTSCVSNLPYNVAVPIVVRLLEVAPGIERFLVMVQREVGERLAAGPGDEQYGAVSVKVAFHAERVVVGSVPRSVFVPRPEVESVLVALRRRARPPVTVPSESQLFELVRAGFSQRRKMLRRSLATVLGDRATAVLETAGIPPTARAEELGLDEWASVARGAAAA
jgi:16S rRNA (adenine1518-N6/adenine1519-N6)-dimethyltransferase